MRFNEYCKLAQRTSNTVTAEGEILNGLMGLCGETGEAMDIWKKVMFQGKPKDVATLGHLRSELGDVAWYLAEALTGICELTGGTPEDVLNENIAKLEARYPFGFDVDRSEHRAENDI